MTKVCIIHQKPSDGTPVKDDLILKTIRGLKQAFKVSTGNQLVVCNAHLEEARKKRAKFEKSLITSAGVGAIFGIIMLVLSIFSQRSLIDILSAIVLLVFLVVVMASLSLYQYFPALEEGPKRKVAAAKAKSARAIKRKRR
jgi:hypothetical protein